MAEYRMVKVARDCLRYSPVVYEAEYEHIIGGVKIYENINLGSETKMRTKSKKEHIVNIYIQ